MIISLNWLKQYTDITVPVNELVSLIGSRLVEIESVTSLSEKYADVRIVRVVTCEDVDGSDHLHLTTIDDGSVVEGVERNADGFVQVVCGAPNVRVGMLAAWLPPASTVPETFGSADPFVLSAKPLRGHVSNGMLASAKELDLFDEHDGIIEVDVDAQPGASFAEAYQLNDVLLDIENKSLTHRPDAFGVIGFAREVAAIQGNTFKTPEWLRDLTPEFSPSGDASIKVVVEDASLSDRFTAIILEGASESAVSPLQMQTWLARSGVRPISAIVDVTNYLMLLTGQPMHAYDYDKFLKVSGGVNEIRVRKGRPNETLTLLDGTIVTLDADDMVIAAGDVAVGLAGVMGGANTEIDASTTRILLECATFDLYNLRGAMMKHGIFTEAITRLTKGVPAALSAPVQAEAVRLLSQHASATLVSGLCEDYPGQRDETAIEISVQHVNAILGTTLSADEMSAVLTAVEMPVEKTSDHMLIVTVPYWRHDLTIAEDIIEEIGRLRGFDEIAPTLPLRTFTAVSPTDFDTFRASLRQALVRSGANEVLTYSFVHGDMMTKAGQNPEEAYRLVNSLSPQLQYFRQSLTPSLLSAIHPNIKAGFDSFALFELNKFHTKRHDLTEENVPKELDSLALVIAYRKKQSFSSYYAAKRYADALFTAIGVLVVYKPLEAGSDYPVSQPFEPKRSARVFAADGTTMLGVVGEYKASVARDFKLPSTAAGFELSTKALFYVTADAGSTYTPLSRYPSIERDMCFQVDQTVTYQTVVDAAHAALAETLLQTAIAPVDIYQGDESVKNITIRITLTSHMETLTSQQAGEVLDKVTEAVIQQTHGKVI